MARFDYDDSRLQKMFAELSEKRQKAALRGGMRRAATLVHKEARSNLKSSGLGNANAVSKSIRKIVFKRRLGFKVTAAASKRGNKGMHRNRRGLLKPVAYWAESGTEGTEPRRTRAPRRSVWARLLGRRPAPGGNLNRGRMPRYGFMEKTKSAVEGRATDMIKTELINNIERVHKKYASD